MQQSDNMINNILHQHSAAVVPSASSSPHMSPTSHIRGPDVSDVVPSPYPSGSTKTDTWTIPRPTAQQVKQWCGGRCGITIFGTVLVFVLLVFLQPDYVCTQVSGQRTSDRNWPVILLLTGLTALAVYMTPQVVSYVFHK